MLPAASSTRDFAVADSTRPIHGDIIVTFEATPDRGWTLRQMPGPAQLRAASGELALRIAHRFARTYHVNLWRRAEGHEVLVERWRRQPVD